MKKYTLAALQMAYLGAKLEREPEGERCPLCLELACSHKADTSNDPFINLTTVSEFKYA
ncbi:hypothetical protein [Bacillus xiapuensis]|uniref:Uncharacterized protein n=1 Tax=Bacillus xiapuensis TaxID=2014075 RepID=A0ABU6NC95_9BACI|nr:hypothetical protein [Bacillus xiapuensis]